MLKGERKMIRHRRKIFDEAIGLLVAQSKTQEACPFVFQERTMRNFAETNITSCTTIIATALGCVEQIQDIDGRNENVIVAEDNPDFLLPKSQFTALVTAIPKNKKIKNELWKAFVKKNPQALNTLRTA